MYGEDGFGPDESWPPDTFMGALREDERDALLSLGYWRAYEAGDPLVCQGEDAAEMLLLLDGLVRVTVAGEDGHVTPLATRGRGEVIGEIAAMDGGQRSATVTAVEPVTALVVSLPQFDVFLRLYHGVLPELTRTMGQRVRSDTQEGQRTAALHVAAALAELGRPVPEGMAVLMTRSELARHVAVADVTVIKVLRTFELRGVVRRSRGRITILRLDALHALVREPSGDDAFWSD